MTATPPPPPASVNLPPPYLSTFQQWKETGDSAHLHATVKHLQPAIDGVLRSMGSADDPTTAVKAKIMATKAVRTYDPNMGAGMPTWVSQQLQPLRRFRRMERSTVRVPERIQLDALHIMKKEQEFTDKHQRDPDLEELADFAKMPIKRISEVRHRFRKVVSQTAIGDAATQFSNQQPTDFSDEALGYVYGDADRVDRAIIEMKTGYGGKHEPMEPNVIAQKLGLSPVQLSRRSARMAVRIDNIRDALSRTS